MSDELDIDVFHLLENMGVDRVHSASGGAEAAFSCPLHGPDERPSAYMNIESSQWYCHGCHERGRNAASLVSKVYGVSYSTAATWLREAYGVDFREPEGGSMVAETEAFFAACEQIAEHRRPADHWEKDFAAALLTDAGAHAYEYIRQRGFDVDAINEWKLGYDYMTDRLIVPVHSLDGQVTGFKGRAMREEQQPKYLILGDYRDPRYGFDQYEASTVVFGLHRSLTVRKCVLCEGELDVIALWSAGIPRPIALGMSYMSERHAKLIIQECDEITIFFDSDSAGFDGMKSIIEKLEPHMTVKIVKPHQGDPAEMDPQIARALVQMAEPSVAQSVVFG